VDERGSTPDVSEAQKEDRPGAKHAPRGISIVPRGLGMSVGPLVAPAWIRMVALVMLVAAPGGGCGLEIPERPSFDTTLYVPLATEQYTGEDLAQTRSAVGGDSIGPLAIRTAASLTPRPLVLAHPTRQGDPFPVDLEEDMRERIRRSLRGIAAYAQVENHFPAGVEIKLHFARTAGALFAHDALTLQGEVALSGTVEPASGRVVRPVESRVALVHVQGDIDLLAERQFFGAMEVTLIGNGEGPVEVWSSDYVTIRGVVAFDCRVE